MNKSRVLYIAWWCVHCPEGHEGRAPHHDRSVKTRGSQHESAHHSNQATTATTNAPPASAATIVATLMGKRLGKAKDTAMPQPAGRSHVQHSWRSIVLERVRVAVMVPANHLHAVAGADVL